MSCLDRLHFRRCRTTSFYFISISLICSISQAKYAYRSIGAFIKHVTCKDAEYLENHPFPEFSLPPEKIEKQSGVKIVRNEKGGLEGNSVHDKERSVHPKSDVIGNSELIMEELRDVNKLSSPANLFSLSSGGKMTNETLEQSDSLKTEKVSV